MGDGSFVELPAESAQRLGLGDEPVSVRRLTGGPRILLLERLDPANTAFPWDRDLVLSADVRAFSLADVMQMLHAAGKSGFLHFEHRECTKSVYLHAGEVVFATSNQPIDRLGQSLVRSGVLGITEYLKIAKSYSPPGHFGRFLVERGMLTPRELWDGVKTQVEEIVRSLFAFGAGQVFFWEGEVRPDNVVRLALPTARLVEEGLDHRDQLLVFLAQLEDSRVRLEAVDGAISGLDGTARAIVRALENVESFPDVCQRVGIDPLSAARTVALLDQMGAVRLVRGAGANDSPDDDAVLRDSVRAHACLVMELTAPVVAVEGPDPVRLRLSDVTRDAATRHAQLLGGLELGPGGAVDPERLLERALCFPGNRLREVREAMGELVSYCEFELLNHPKVKDAEDFLDGLAALRAQL
jgi:hypothetical protein